MESGVRRAERRQSQGRESRGSEGGTCVRGEGLVWPGVKEGRAGPSALGGRWLLTPLWASCSSAPGLSPQGRPRYQGGPDLRVAL